jgi:hypothetical protein
LIGLNLRNRPEAPILCRKAPDLCRTAHPTE